MQTRHGRVVTVDDASIWVPEVPQASLDPMIDPTIDPDVLLPVLRISFDQPGPQGIAVPVVRFLPNETYPEAKEALLSHFDPRCRQTARETRGYFLAVA
jgi:hypothetical protein